MEQRQFLGMSKEDLASLKDYVYNQNKKGIDMFLAILRAEQNLLTVNYEEKKEEQPEETGE